MSPPTEGNPPPAIRHASAGRRRGKTVLRWCVLAIAVALAWPDRASEGDWASVVVPSLSPLVGLGGPLAARSWTIFALLSVSSVLLIWFVPRALCRHVCPVGLLQETVTWTRRGAHSPRKRFPRLGAPLAMLALGSAAVGYPFLLWFDPFAIFNGALNGWRIPLTWAGAAAGAALPLLLLVELAAPRLWCTKLCPLGGLQDVCIKARRGLGRCCHKASPETQQGTGKGASGRRLFFSACAGAAGAVAMKRAGAASPQRLRPPGAVAEDQFTGICVRCGNCAQACPVSIIKPDLAGRIDGWLAPRMDFSTNYCREDCNRCGLVCPSGALARIPLERKKKARIGVAKINLDSCLMALGRECNACVQACPYEAITIAAGRDGFSSEPRVNAALCNGCGACEVVCPVEPVRAVRVEPLTDV